MFQTHAATKGWVLGVLVLHLTTLLATTMPASATEPSTDLRTTLTTQSYATWHATSHSVRASKGSHPMRVRVFVNDALLGSLKTAPPPAREHPQGAIAVKEIFDANGTLTGWAAMQKMEPKSRVGQGWMWLEVNADGSTKANGRSVRACVGCHAPGDDFVMSRVAP